MVFHRRPSLERVPSRCGTAGSIRPPVPAISAENATTTCLVPIVRANGVGEAKRGGGGGVLLLSLTLPPHPTPSVVGHSVGSVLDRPNPSRLLERRHYRMRFATRPRPRTLRTVVELHGVRAAQASDGDPTPLLRRRGSGRTQPAGQCGAAVAVGSGGQDRTVQVVAVPAALRGRQVGVHIIAVELVVNQHPQAGRALGEGPVGARGVVLVPEEKLAGRVPVRMPAGVPEKRNRRSSEVVSRQLQRAVIFKEGL